MLHDGSSTELEFFTLLIRPSQSRNIEFILYLLKNHRACFWFLIKMLKYFDKILISFYIAYENSRGGHLIIFYQIDNR